MPTNPKATGLMQQLPLYKCHKEVRALKIKSIELDANIAAKEGRETDGSAIIYPVEKLYVPFRVGQEYRKRHNPEVGGYYVVYEDGYKSFSPAEAFEEGYTLIE